MTDANNFKLEPALDEKCVKAASDSVLALVQSDAYRAALAADLLTFVAGGPASYMGVPADRITPDMLVAEPHPLPQGGDSHGVNVLLLTTLPIRVPNCFVLLVLPSTGAVATNPNMPEPVEAEEPGQPALLVWRDNPGQVGSNTIISLHSFERDEILRQLALAGVTGPQFFYLTQLEGKAREPEQH